MYNTYSLVSRVYYPGARAYKKQLPPPPNHSSHAAFPDENRVAKQLDILYQVARGRLPRGNQYACQHDRHLVSRNYGHACGRHYCRYRSHPGTPKSCRAVCCVVMAGDKEMLMIHYRILGPVFHPLHLVMFKFQSQHMMMIKESVSQPPFSKLIIFIHIPYNIGNDVQTDEDVCINEGQAYTTTSTPLLPNAPLLPATTTTATTASATSATTNTTITTTWVFGCCCCLLFASVVLFAMLWLNSYPFGVPI